MSRVTVLAVLWSHPLFAFTVPCGGHTDPSDIATALARIRASVDPCGESPQVVALLDKVTHCAAANYQICTDLQSERNFFDRPVDAMMPRTITWNPKLRTTLEVGCAGNPTRPVRRDATASLLHELAHAAQDCDGREPGAYEFEAVRIENIYRRAMGMCQRTKYGDDPLPAEMITTCEPSHCTCTAPAGTKAHPVLEAASAAPDTSPADGAVSADSQPSGALP